MSDCSHLNSEIFFTLYFSLFQNDQNVEVKCKDFKDNSLIPMYLYFILYLICLTISTEHRQITIH